MLVLQLPGPNVMHFRGMEFSFLRRVLMLYEKCRLMYVSYILITINPLIIKFLYIKNQQNQLHEKNYYLCRWHVEPAGRKY